MRARSDPGKKRTFRLSSRYYRPGSDPQPCCRTTFLAPLGAPSGLHQDHPSGFPGAGGHFHNGEKC